jgi:uncharacterized protein
MKPFIEYVVKSLVDFPDQVDVREVEGEKMTVFQLRLNKADVGKVIGKQGRTIQALRTLVNGGSIKQGKRAVVEIIEEKKEQENPQAAQSAEAVQDENVSEVTSTQGGNS